MTKKEKLVLMISSSIGGGAQKLLLDIAPCLIDFYDLKILCPDGYLPQRLRAVGIVPDIFEVNLKTIPAIKKHILQWAGTEPFTVNPYLFGTAFFVCRAFAHTPNCKIVSLLLNPVIRTGMPLHQRLAYKWIARSIGKHSHRIVVGSPELADEVAQLCGRETQYLENRVPNITQRRERMYDAIGDQPLKVCFAARMAEQKRPDIFVQTAKLTRDANRNVRYFMAGEGHLKEGIVQYVTDNDLGDVVTFTNFFDDIYEFLFDTDVLLCTSEFENTPLIILNAMNAGMPVIAGKVTGIPHLINDGVDGILTETFTPEGFYDAIIQILDKPGLYRTLSENSYKKAIEEFSYQDFVNRYREILNH